MSSTTTLENKNLPVSAKIVSTALLALSVVALLWSFYAIIGGVMAVVVLVLAFILLIVRFVKKEPVAIVLVSLTVALGGVLVAALGLQAQYHDVRVNCDVIPDKGSAEHVACFQRNYSPWRGLIHTM